MASASPAAPGGLHNLEKELVCFICTEVLYQPLTLIDCLHTFCGACLKEWFSHQHRKALQSPSSSVSNPYTCPTCRATVKDARHNATVTTLLDMFLTAEPSRGRTAEEKEEYAAIYKPGDDILPRIEPRRRDRRSRRDEEEEDARERRMMEEARERSLREQRPDRRDALPVPSSDRHGQSRSRDRDRRDRHREPDRAERRRRVETAEAAMARDSSAHQSTLATVSSSNSPSPTSPRHPDAVEARQRMERNVARQTSLRSLVSVSESGTGTGDSLDELRIMQEILAEGWIDGIDVENLTESEQDALSQRIAAAYRQRHPRRDHGAPPLPPREAGAASANPRRPASETQPRQRSRSSQPGAAEGARSDLRLDQAPSRPPPSDSLAVPVPSDRGHRRRASEESRRQTSPARPSGRSTSSQSAQRPADGSATDLAVPPLRSETSSDDRIRRLSDARRTNTVPAQSSPRASEVWQQGGIVSHTHRPGEADPSTPPVGTATRLTIGRTQPATAVPVPDARPAPVERRSEPAPTVAAAAVEPPTTSSTYDEPQVKCSRCARVGIQYEVHKHCSPCAVDICLSCYRSGRGCNHWFGFGHSALPKFEASAPERSSKLLEPPHVPVSRQYQRPATGGLGAPAILLHTTTTHLDASSSDPADRLREGHFCDRCGAFANSCFWSCEYCNEGEWGFCNDCVDTHHCCTHPLLPVAHKSTMSASSTPPHSADYDTSSRAVTSNESHHHHTTSTHSRPSTSHSSASQQSHNPSESDYTPLTISAHCDLCNQPILPAHSRYHCPSHSTASSAASTSDKHNLGGFDICTTCYHTISRAGRLKRDDGPAGWRKCPSGHRMVVLVFESDGPAPGQRRVIMNDLVGGWKCGEEEMRVWDLKNREGGSSGPASPPLVASGKWSWREDSAGTRKSRARSSTLTSGALASPSSTNTASSTKSFPPDGGFGKRCIALWSYYPEPGEDGKGELMFPKGAEVAEVEDINGEWFEGVYMGERGVFPGVYVREIAR